MVTTIASTGRRARLPWQRAKWRERLDPLRFRPAAKLGFGQQAARAGMRALERDQWRAANEIES